MLQADTFSYGPFPSATLTGTIAGNITFDTSTSNAVVQSATTVTCTNPTGSFKACVPIVCTGNMATNGIKCPDDEVYLSGNLDINRTKRANQAGCTGPQKCEWSCPVDKPVYCGTKNECVVNADDCGCGVGEKMCGNGQCIAGNLSCPLTSPASCNNNGICDNNESCDCADCTNGDADDTNNCKSGLRCTKDATQPTCIGAGCCGVGMAWSCDLNTCINSCGTHVPSELKS